MILLPELKPPVVSHTLPDTWVLSTLEQGSFGVVGRESRWALTCLLPSTASAFGATGQQAPPPTAGIRSERSQRGAVEATLVVATYLSQAGPSPPATLSMEFAAGAIGGNSGDRGVSGGNAAPGASRRGWRGCSAQAAVGFEAPRKWLAPGVGHRCWEDRAVFPEARGRRHRAQEELLGGQWRGVCTGLGGLSLGG